MNNVTSTRLIGTLLSLCLAFPLSTHAVTLKDATQWLKNNHTAKITFQPGDVITHDQAESIRPFLPFGMEEELIFPGMEMPIKPTSDLSPAAVYKEVTKKHQGKVSLGGVIVFGHTQDDGMRNLKEKW